MLLIFFIVIFSDLLMCSSLIGAVSWESDDSGHSQSEEDSTAVLRGREFFTCVFVQ